MIDLAKFILKKMFLGQDKLSFALPRIFPPSDPKLSAIRMKNFISTYLVWKYGLELKTKPVMLQIGPVRGCNLNCVMCGAGNLKIQKLPFDDFKMIIGKFPEAMFISLSDFGEPFLSKDTIKMIKYAQKKAIVTMTSNFTVLPDPEEVVNSGLFEIYASIDSFDKQKYDFIRRGGDINLIIDRTKMKGLYQEALRNQIFKGKYEHGNMNGNTLDIVVKNLKSLVEARRKLRKKFPIIGINSVYAKETKEDAEDIIKNAIDLGVDMVRFQRLEFDIPGVLRKPEPDDFNHILNLKEKYKNQVEVSILKFEFGGDYSKGYCYFAHFMTVITAHKRIFPCCMAYLYMYIDEALLGLAISEKDIEVAMEKRQEFIRNFRYSVPTFCRECSLYFRK
jgi:MoaA/NifB/PqqE/SkfB family radical SAM enzyme